MELMDFSTYPPFLALRKKMGAELLGEFELINPELHLTYDERNLLLTGITVTSSSLAILPDNTLQYKNGRVIVLGEQLFHLADCEVVSRCLQQPPREIQVLGGGLDLGQREVCSHCLQRLNFQGFERVRQRHRQQTNETRLSFSVADFYHRFPPYPVKVERPWAMVLGV